MSTNARAVATGALVAASIERCQSCAEVCIACAHACMDNPAAYDLRACIRMNFDCADTCVLAAKLLSRSELPKRELVIRALDLTMAVCRACAEECERHIGERECCREAALECRSCEEACTLAIQDMGGATGLVQTNRALL